MRVKLCSGNTKASTEPHPNRFVGEDDIRSGAARVVMVVAGGHQTSCLNVVKM